MKASKLDSILGHSKGYDLAMKDSDGDKLINILDCKPYNKHKQGLIHEIGSKFAGKFLKGKSQENVEAWANRGREASRVETEAKQENRLRFIREREKIRTNRKLDYERKGGFFGSMATAMPQRAKATTTKRVKVKGKKGKTRIIYVNSQAPQQPRQPRQPMSTDFTTGHIFIK